MIGSVISLFGFQLLYVDCMVFYREERSHVLLLRLPNRRRGKSVGRWEKSTLKFLKYLNEEDRLNGNNVLNNKVNYDWPNSLIAFLFDGS